MDFLKALKKSVNDTDKKIVGRNEDFYEKTVSAKYPDAKVEKKRPFFSKRLIISFAAACCVVAVAVPVGLSVFNKDDPNTTDSGSYLEANVITEKVTNDLPDDSVSHSVTFGGSAVTQDVPYSSTREPTETDNSTQSSGGTEKNGGYSQVTVGDYSAYAYVHNSGVETLIVKDNVSGDTLYYKIVYALTITATSAAKTAQVEVDVYYHVNSAYNLADAIGSKTYTKQTEINGLTVLFSGNISNVTLNVDAYIKVPEGSIYLSGCVKPDYVATETEYYDFFYAYVQKFITTE